MIYSVPHQNFIMENIIFPKSLSFK